MFLFRGLYRVEEGQGETLQIAKAKEPKLNWQRITL